MKKRKRTLLAITFIIGFIASIHFATADIYICYDESCMGHPDHTCRYYLDDGGLLEWSAMRIDPV